MAFSYLIFGIHCINSHASTTVESTIKFIVLVDNTQLSKVIYITLNCLLYNICSLFIIPTARHRYFLSGTDVGVQCFYCIFDVSKF